MSENERPEGDQDPESEGDQWRNMVRAEVGSFARKYMEQLGGLESMLDLVVQKVVEEVVPRLPQVDVNAIADLAAQQIEGKMQQTAQQIGSQIEARASSATNGQAPAGQNQAPAGQDSAHAHENQAHAPEGYVAPVVSLNGGSAGERVMESLKNDPIAWLDWAFNKFMTLADRYTAQKSSTDKLAVLRQMQTDDPELLAMFAPNPLGAEFTKMLSETYMQGVRAKMGANPHAYAPEPAKPYNPFDLGVTPNDGWTSGPADQSRPLFGEAGSQNGWSGPKIGPTTLESETPSNGPKSMAEMMRDRP